MAVLFDTGLSAELVEGQTVVLSAFCQRRGVSFDALLPLVEYLVDKGALDYDGNGVRLLPIGKDLLDVMPFGMLHLAYQPVFLRHISALVRESPKYERDVRRAAEASGLINAASTFKTVINSCGTPKGSAVLDLGCGDGTFLQMYREMWPGVRLAGLDSDPQSVEKAKQRLLSVDVIVKSIADVATVRELSSRLEPTWVFAFFVLHEVGSNTSLISELLSAVFTEAPEVRVAVTECYRPTTDQCRRHNRQQFAEFKLFHSLSQQALLTRDEWRHIVGVSGGRVVDNLVHFGDESDPLVETLIIRGERGGTSREHRRIDV
jgi:SAM-dependent methyltransferase